MPVVEASLTLSFPNMLVVASLNHCLVFRVQVDFGF